MKRFDSITSRLYVVGSFVSADSHSAALVDCGRVSQDGIVASGCADPGPPSPTNSKAVRIYAPPHHKSISNDMMSASLSHGMTAKDSTVVA